MKGWKGDVKHKASLTLTLLTQLVKNTHHFVILFLCSHYELADSDLHLQSQAFFFFTTPPRLIFSIWRPSVYRSPRQQTFTQQLFNVESLLLLQVQ